MSYGAYPPYDPARGGYYVPAGYPPDGYPPHPPPPQSPTGPPPARPHTTAPFPSPSQYAPPPGAHYYGMPPPPSAGPPPTPGGGHLGPAEYPPMPPALPASAPAPKPSPASPAQFGDMSPEQLQGMIDQLNRLKMGKTASPAPAPALPAAPAPPPARSPPPRIDTSMGMPPQQHGAPPHSARPMTAHYPYPPYGYLYGRPGPASHSGEVSSPSAAPSQGRSHPSPHPPPKSKTPAPGPMPGAFAPEVPAPPLAPAPPPPAKIPALAPSGRPEPARKVSGQMSEMSFGSSKSHDMAHAWELWGGPLVEVAAGREPRPKPKLVALFRGIAAYMVALLEPTHSCVVTLSKLIQFYNTFAVGEGEASEWQRFFNLRSPKVLSELFCALNVEHHLVPTKPNQPPTLPGLTPRGFEVWMFTQLMTAPHREWHRISRILDQWTIFDQGSEMPKIIPRECFPQTEDRAIYQGWWQAVREDYPEETSDSDDERKVPLGLPEPEKPRRRGYSVRGDGPSDTSPEDSGPKDPPSPAPPSLTRKRTARPYSTTNVVPDDFLTPEEKDSSPVDRFRNPYSPAQPPPPGWKEDPRREEVNPRPTLGEEPSRPPTRSRSTKPKGGSTKDSATRHTKRGRSVRRRRDDSPDRYSDEEYDDVKYDGYGKKYEGDGLYEDPSPPTRATTPHHPSYNPREPSRGPTASRKAEKDIRDYTYQEQYEKDYVAPPPTVPATRKSHRGNDTHLHHGSRKGGWRYA